MRSVISVRREREREKRKLAAVPNYERFHLDEIDMNSIKIRHSTLPASDTLHLMPEQVHKTRNKCNESFGACACIQWHAASRQTSRGVEERERGVGAELFMATEALVKMVIEIYIFTFESV